MLYDIVVLSLVVYTGLNSIILVLLYELSAVKKLTKIETLTFIGLSFTNLFILIMFFSIGVVLCFSYLRGFYLNQEGDEDGDGED